MSEHENQSQAWEGILRLAILDDYEGMMSRAPATTRLREHVKVDVFNKSMTQGELVRAVKDHQMLLTIRERTRFDAKLFEQLPLLKLVFQTGGHAYHIDIDAATRAGVAVVLGRKAQSPAKAVPELVFGLTISLLRQLSTLDRDMKTGGWRESPEHALGGTLNGRTLGILGLGRHGTPVARLAQAFGMQVVAWGPTLTDERAEREGVKRLELEDLLKTSDVVSVHLRLSEDSRGLLDQRRLSLMREDALLINTARGAIVDEEALINVLSSRQIRGAGLDVYAHEPLPEDSQLRSLPNTLLTPHIGWTVEEVFKEFAEIACGQVEGYMTNSLPTAEIINPHALDIASRKV